GSRCPTPALSPGPAVPAQPAVLLGGLALGCRGERAYLTRADDSTGRCTYSFTVASPVEAACPSAGGGPEVRAELASLAARLSRLESRERGAGGSGPRGVEAGGARDSQQAAPAGGLEDAYGELLRAKSRLEEEKGRLERENAELRRRLESSTQEIARLRATRCFPGGEGHYREAVRAPAPGWNPQPLTYQELQSERTEVPASRMLEETVLSRPGTEDSGCGELVWVGEPVVFGRADSIAGKYGVWMKDPEPVPPFTRETTWRVDTVGTEVRQLFQYEAAEQLAQGYPAKVHILPRPLESNGAVIYRGGLFFQPQLNHLQKLPVGIKCSREYGHSWHNPCFIGETSQESSGEECWQSILQPSSLLVCSAPLSRVLQVNCPCLATYAVQPLWPRSPCQAKPSHTLL
uniref:Myocilin n=1 Tax=Amazona collaria TaxID=241587 RepID=A0A8B9FMA8_9PSIT